jgi:murein DD-endopeptidase MepM/ murein hydrolase activator NlpD
MNKDNAKKLFHDIANIFISSPYGNRNAIYDSKGKLVAPAMFHEGVDYSANGKSVPVYAIEDGIVLYEGYDNSTGAIICYVHYPRLERVGLYYHLACTYISKGDKVNSDTKIGMTGNTGLSAGIHLHFNWFKYSDYGKNFYSRAYEDYDKYVFPSEIERYGTPVEPNLNADQVEVLTQILNVRETPNGKLLGYINEGLYNILNKQDKDGYTWYEVEEGKWIAYSKEWATFYHKQEIILEPPVEEEQPSENNPVDEQIDVGDIDTPTEPETPRDEPVIEPYKPSKINLLDLIKKLIELILKLFNKGGK